MQSEASFREIAGFPNAIAAVDGCHIPISAPANDAVYYVNRKNFHSLLLQAICDSKRRFIDVFAGVCGSVHDARVWEMSDIKMAIEEDQDRFCPQQTHIVGDSAYGLSETLMTPFRDNGHLTRTEKNYNIAHSRTRVVIERSFALLKGRFRRLKYLYLQNVIYGPLIIVACCVLHNICLDFDDEMNAEILEEVDDLVDDDAVKLNGENKQNVAVSVVDKRNNIAELLMRL
ncbi:putative nuclease HARBI1 [Leptopilina heterotoma]|uniref:putative nuclease HARBI1 n=1 Tax=Leptopilina heterotoma TaxID=63436 RepID=UPI001CA952A2|nr:putative nuclease HARBI1 [Leptopilina heterotoma]